MGDAIEDSFENSDVEEQETERPRTPDYHNERQEQQLPDDKGDKNSEPPSDSHHESPENTDGQDEEVCNDKQENVEPSSPSDSEKDKDVIENQQEIKSTDNSLSDSKSFDEEPMQEAEESEDTKPGSPGDSSGPKESGDNDIASETAVNGKDVSLEENHNDDEDLEIPLSPIGDLGLSEPEASIVNDILKGDVSEMISNADTESHASDTVKGRHDDDDDKHNEDVDDRKSKNEEQTSPAISDVENDEEKVGDPADIGDEDELRSEPEEAGEQLIADIFGASDEEEEFEGFDQEEIELTKTKQDLESKKKSKPMISDDDDDDNDVGATSQLTKLMVVPKPKDDKDDSDSEDEYGRVPVWDFDVMMEQKKASRARRRRKGDGDIISDNDDLVAEMIKQMKQASEEDKMLNEAKQAATKKLKLMPLVLKHLNKADLQFTFIDSGILNAIKEWLSPLPDGSLPHLQIRTGLLKILTAFPALDTGALKMSGLGKAVMFIFRHPREIRQNRDMAGKLINEWARPIFGVTSNFKSMSREEREERDYQNMSKRRRLSSADEGSKTPRSIDRAIQGEKKAACPGEKGFVMRARVPTPSNKDYVVRPKSNVDYMDFHRGSPKTVSRADKQMRKFKDRNKIRDATRTVISIEGRNMSL